ncbi:hypothetical protein IAT38_005898 [Cryptococcus sp. DSM 104549]
MATTTTTSVTPPSGPFTFTLKANAQQATTPSSTCKDVANEAQRFIDKTALLHAPALMGGAMGDTTAVDYRYSMRFSDGQPWPLHFVAFKWQHPVTKANINISRVELCRAWEIARNDTLDLSKIIMILTNSKFTKDPVFKACLDRATILVGCYYELAIALATIHEWEATSHVPTSWASMPAPSPSLAALHNWPHRLIPGSPTPKTITPVFLHAAHFLLSTDPNDLAAFRIQVLQHMEGTPLGLEGYTLPAGFYLSESGLRQEDLAGDAMSVQDGGKRTRRSNKMPEKPRHRGASAARAIWALDPVLPHQREEATLPKKRLATVAPPQPTITPIRLTIPSPQPTTPTPEPTFPPAQSIILFARGPAPSSPYPAAVWMRRDLTEYRETQEEDSSDEDEVTVGDNDSDWDEDGDQGPVEQHPPSPPQTPASDPPETIHDVQDDTPEAPHPGQDDSTLDSAGPTDSVTSTRVWTQEEEYILAFITALIVFKLLSIFS